jgi:hypothetical protein
LILYKKEREASKAWECDREREREGEREREREDISEYTHTFQSQPQGVPSPPTWLDSLSLSHTHSTLKHRRKREV